MISQVSNTVKKFLQDVLEAEAVRVVSVNETSSGWVAEANVAEKNQCLASTESSYRVIDEARYIVKLDENLEVFSYKEVKPEEEE